jgi:hypothetical protein
MADAHHAGRLQAELVRLGRYPLLVIDPCRTWNYADRGAHGWVGDPCGGGLRAVVTCPGLGIVTRPVAHWR